MTGFQAGNQSFMLAVIVCETNDWKAQTANLKMEKASNYYCKQGTKPDFFIWKGSLCIDLQASVILIYFFFTLGNQLSI